MTTSGTKTSAKQQPAQQTITPYLTVKRAEQLVEFVKTGLLAVSRYSEPPDRPAACTPKSPSVIPS